MALLAEGNSIVMNQGLNPLVSYNYMLRVEGVFDLPCKKVHSFTKKNEYEYIQEGGLNDYVHMRRKPAQEPFTFQVERYVGVDLYDPLQNGADLILPVILLVTRYANRFDITKRAYVFTGCTVMAKEYGELNAEESGLLTETTTIGYREMMVVTVSDKDMKKWGFDGTDVRGNGEQSARVYHAPPVPEEEGKNQSSLWKFDGTKPEGEGLRKAAEDRESTEAGNRLWEFGDTVMGKGERSAKIGQTTKAEGRKWPAVASAKTYTPVTKEEPEKK